jgi:hypothetical protein
MRFEEDRLPTCGPDDAKLLGVRGGSPPAGDIPLHGNSVWRGTGGMSVSPPPVEHLPPYRRPPEHRGTSKKLKVFELETDELPEELWARVDPTDPERHVLIEPAWEMSLYDYQQALEATRSLWRVLEPPEDPTWSL